MMHSLVHEMDQIELAGPIERLRSNLVSGIKHMPVRFKRMHAHGEEDRRKIAPGRRLN
jgi:hypothetical protein